MEPRDPSSLGFTTLSSVKSMCVLVKLAMTSAKASVQHPAWALAGCGVPDRLSTSSQSQRRAEAKGPGTPKRHCVQVHAARSIEIGWDWVGLGLKSEGQWSHPLSYDQSDVTLFIESFCSLLQPEVCKQCLVNSDQ